MKAICKQCSTPDRELTPDGICGDCYDQNEVIAAVPDHSGEPDVISQFRKIVATKSMGKINGQIVDLLTASAVVAVYDAMSAPHQARFARLPVRSMAHIAVQFVR